MKLKAKCSKFRNSQKRNEGDNVSYKNIHSRRFHESIFFGLQEEEDLLNYSNSGEEMIGIRRWGINIYKCVLWLLEMVFVIFYVDWEINLISNFTDKNHPNSNESNHGELTRLILNVSNCQEIPLGDFLKHTVTRMLRNIKVTK